MRFNILVKLFPNLRKLYIGSTQTCLYDLKLIVRNLKKLNLLCVSNCKNVNLGDIPKELSSLFNRTTIKTLFIDENGVSSVVEILLNQDINIITKNIDILLRDFSVTGYLNLTDITD